MTTRESLEKWGINKEETMRKECTDTHPVEDNSTNQMPMPLNWAKDVDESVGLSPIYMDTKSTVHVEKSMAKTPVVPTPPATYGPHDLSALCSGTQNPWSTLSHCHCQHHRSQ